MADELNNLRARLAAAEARAKEAERADWTVDDSVVAGRILTNLGFSVDASLEPFADQRRDRIAAIICKAREATDLATLGKAMREAQRAYWNVPRPKTERAVAMWDAEAAFDAALAQAGDRTDASHGYAIVPKEPTAAMLEAVWSLRASNGGDATRACYAALLEAAQSGDRKEERDDAE